MINVRLLKRRVKRLFRPFLTRSERARLTQAIADVERATTGEIHVHVIAHSKGRDMLELAREAFEGLGLYRTRERNGVLVLVSHLDHRWAIRGDEGINAAAGQALWKETGQILEKHFRDNRYAQGLETCVREVGRALAARFPRGKGENPNELPDEPTHG